MESNIKLQKAIRRNHTFSSHSSRPVMRTTYQLAARLGPKRGQDLNEVWNKAIKSIIGWIRSRCATELPQEAWEGKDFECGVPGHQVECVTIPSQGLWSLRLTHPDAPYGNHDAMPGRTWTSELALKRGGTKTHQLGVRLFCTSQPYCEAEITLTRPKVVQFLANNFVLSTIRKIQGKPWYLDTDADLGTFYNFITDPKRVLPVFLLTEIDVNKKYFGEVKKYILDEHKIAKLTLGLAHIVVLPHDTSFGWTKRVGKVWSAFQGAVRTYKPCLNFETDSPFSDHPLALPENIILMRYKSMCGEEAFMTSLVDWAHQASATRQVDWNGCFFFTDAKHARAENVLREANEEADWRLMYQDEIKALKQKIKENEEERDEMMELVIQAEKDRDYYIDENKSLRWQIESLRKHLTEKTDEGPDASVEIPDNYEDLPDWVRENLTGRLILHPRAIHHVKDASYENVELVYQVLLLLANEYRNMRLNYDDAQEAFNKRMDALKVECSPSISREHAGKERDTYYLQYPSHTNKKRFLESHIRKGKRREQRYCLAVYFLWDDETNQVVVGWLPSHLDNRMT